MLVRADPSTDSISLLSFPRDMRVEIRCPGRTPFFDKINAAYANCGPQGSLQTVRALTGVQINYLITVNFRGFRQIVDRLDGAWIDVDRRYFNDRGGPSGYATINLRPGYQQLTGRQTLDYVRYRHTDSDLYRVARQQQFVKAFKGQIQESFAPDRVAEGRQRDHEQRRGRAGRRHRRRRSHGALVRALRVRAPARAASSRRGSRASKASRISRPTRRTSRGRSRTSRTRTSSRPRRRRPWRSARR